MLIAVSDDGAAVRECNALRAVLSPGDPTPKTVAARVTAQRTAGTKRGIRKTPRNAGPVPVKTSRPDTAPTAA